MKAAFRFISVFMALLIVFAASGCSPKTDNVEDTTENQTESNSQTTAEETTPTALDTGLTLPDTTKFDGTIINILIRDNYTEEFIAEKITGDHLNDAIYERQIQTESVLGVKLNYITCEPGSQNLSFHTRIRNSVSAGDKDFDLVAGYAYYLPALANEGVFCNWHDVEYIDFSRAWWGSRSDMADILTIDGRLFFISGDASLLYIQKAFCVFANTNLLSENNIDINTLYAAVNDGTWTLDKLIQVSSDLSKDLNGDGQFTDADQYGFNLYLKTVVDNFFNAFDIPIVASDKNGNYSIGMNTERMYDVVSKLHSLVYGGNPAQAFRTLLSDSSSANFASYYAKNGPVFEKGLEDLIETYKKIKN